MSFIAPAFGIWLLRALGELVGGLADAGRTRLGDSLRGSQQERAMQEAATVAITEVARQLRPTLTAADDPHGADHLARVLDQVSQEAPAPEESLAEHPTLLQGLQARIAARLIVLADADITEVDHSSAELLELGVSVPILTDLLTSRLLWELKVRNVRGGPLKPLVDQLNSDVTHLQGQRHTADLARIAKEMQAARASLQRRLEQQAGLVREDTSD